MPVKINGATSGSVTLAAPATGTDVTVTLPGSTMNLATELNSKLPIAGGKILQIVRATDTTRRSTTSTSYVDVTGMSVSITPSLNTSIILVVAAYRAGASRATSGAYVNTQITDSSNNVLSGGQASTGIDGTLWEGFYTPIGYAAPATTSSVTYKLRFSAAFSGGTTTIYNDLTTGQMYAIEVSA